MALTRLTPEFLERVGLLGAVENTSRGTLTFRFVDRDEVWTLAPANYPIDGSCEVVIFNGRIYAAPPAGTAS